VALQRKLDEKKSKHASLAQQKWFWPSICAEAGERHSQRLPLAIDWLHSLIAQGGVPIRSLPRMCSSSFSFMGGVGK